MVKTKFSSSLDYVILSVADNGLREIRLYTKVTEDVTRLSETKSERYEPHQGLARQEIGGDVTRLSKTRSGRYEPHQ
ncbi:hypothetical protein RRG08_033768 [Elysia crispata]|uniref:Uncharacterized protein n=1 Tax=Elysia crispata TaxID=231223 RepID=A0AAE1AS82_9GAST|nr:hypothetical protein RRG08_033768 [Elysia crispata]